MFNNTARRNTPSVNNYNILLYMTTYHWKHYRQKYTTKNTSSTFLPQTPDVSPQDIRDKVIQKKNTHY